MESAIEVGKRTFRITRPASADALFDEEQFEKDESIPYWADLWPSAIALARHVSSMNLSGKRAVELGCGVGLPSVAALERGAEVVATDHYKGALDFAAHNAKANVGRSIGTALLDWREPEFDSLGTFDLVLAADVLYERINVRFLVELIPRLLEANGTILLADPRRPGAELFVEEVSKKGFRHSRTTVAVEQEGREIEVNTYSFRGATSDSGSAGNALA